MKITPKKIYDFAKSRLNIYNKERNKQKAISYIGKSTGAIVDFVKKNEQTIIQNGDELSYILCTRYRHIFDEGNRYLPYRWSLLANEAYDMSNEVLDWTANPSVLIVGAGDRNPYSLALFFLLKGAKKVYCLEPSSFEQVTVMSRLYETVCQIAFGVIDTPEDVTLEKVAEFLDLKALACGDFDNVFKNNCIEVLQDVAEKIQLKDNSIDFIYSRSVLEHVRDIQQVYRENKRILSLDGCMLHQIDLSSHNRSDPVSMYYTPLPELASFDHINKKRLVDHLTSIEDLKMKVSVLEKKEHPVSTSGLLPEFQNYSQSELETISASLLIQK